MGGHWLCRGGIRRSSRRGGDRYIQRGRCVSKGVRGPWRPRVRILRDIRRNLFGKRRGVDGVQLVWAQEEGHEIQRQGLSEIW